MPYDMICPYCDEGFDYCDDEPLGEGVTDETQCPSCDKNFTFTRSYSVSYDTSKADCLNGSPHDFKLVRRFPRVVQGHLKLRCNACDKSENRKSNCPHGGPYCMDCET